jgi:hypothetical protein
MMIVIVVDVFFLFFSYSIVFFSLGSRFPPLSFVSFDSFFFLLFFSFLHIVHTHPRYQVKHN